MVLRLVQIRCNFRLCHHLNSTDFGWMEWKCCFSFILKQTRLLKVLCPPVHFHPTTFEHRNLTENLFSSIAKIRTWVRVRNPNQWSLREKKKKEEVLSLTLYFQCLWLSSWQGCGSGIPEVSGLWGRTGTSGGLWWAVVGWCKRKQPAKPGGTWASQIPLLDFPSQGICPSRRLPEEQSCLEKQNNANNLG